MTNSRKLSFSHISFSAMATALLLAGTGTAARAQQDVAQGTLTIVDDCPDGQATSESGSCFNVVKTHQMYVASQEEIDRVLAENGWRLATPDEVSAAWENLGLHTGSAFRLSDGTHAIPVQNKVGLTNRGVNFRSADLPDFLVKGILYVDAAAPAIGTAPAQAPASAPAEQIIMGTVTVTDAPASVPAPGSPAPSNQLTISGAAGEPVEIADSSPNAVSADSSLSTLRCPIEGQSNFMLDGWYGQEREVLEAAQLEFSKDSSWAAMGISAAEFERQLPIDAELRWKFAPFMIEAAWSIFLKEEGNRSPAETSFMNRFAPWSGCDKNLTARRNLNRWLAFTGERADAGNVGSYWVDPNPDYEPFTFSSFSHTGPSVSDFDTTNGGNPMYMGKKAQVAIASLGKPALIKMTDFPDPEGLRFIDDDMRSLTARMGVGIASPTSVWPMVGFEFIDKGVTAKDVYETYEAFASGTNTILSLLGVDLSFPTEGDGTSRALAETAVTTFIINLISAVAPKMGDVLGSAGFSFAATVLEAKLTDVIETDRYEEALRRDASNQDPVPVVPSRLRFDPTRHWWDGPVSAEDIERSALFAMLMKFLIAKPADMGALTLQAPTLECPVGTKKLADSCIADIRFYRQKDITFAEAQAIAQSNRWKIAPGDALKEADDISPFIREFGLISDGDRISPRAGNAVVDPTCSSSPSCNQGFYYFPTLLEGPPYSRTNRVIQNAVGFERLGDNPWIISRAWPHNPDTLDFGDPNHPKFGAFLMENRNARGEYAYADNGVFKIGRIDPNDPRAEWHFENASKGFSWIKPHASHETYLQMDGGALRIAPSDPTNKGALWYTGGMGLVLATPK